MRLILDGKPSEREARAENIVLLVEEYLRQALAGDRVMLACRLNGTEVGDDPLNVIRLNLAEDQIETVEIITRSKEELVRDTVKTAAAYLGSLLPAVQRMAEDLGAGRKFAAGRWELISEGLEWLAEALDGLERQRRFLPAGAGSPGELVGEMNRTLAGLLAAMGIRDMVTVADLLEYELADQLERIEGTLGSYLAFWERQQ